MRPVGNHIQVALLRAITSVAGFDGPDRQKPILIVQAVHSRDWASATFVGATHHFALRIDGEAAAVAAAVQRLVETLPENEIALGGQIVAEIAITLWEGTSITDNMIAKCLTVNVLTIED